MDKREDIKALLKRYSERDKFLNGYFKEYDKELLNLQKQLYTLIATEYVTQFTTFEDGSLKLSEKNAVLLNTELGKLFNQFKVTFAEDVFKKTAETMLKTMSYTSDYYRAQNFSSKTLANIEDKLNIYKTTIGIDSKGNVIKGSFIDQLASQDQTKQTLADYTRKNLEAQTDLKTFREGFKTLIQGADGIDGSIEKYSRNFVKSAILDHAQQVDNFFGQELGLDIFLYAGDEMETSRPLCIEMHGNYYTRQQGEELNDHEWQGKWPGYDFFTKKGGYNCRHNVMWVADSYYKMQGFKDIPNDVFTD